MEEGEVEGLDEGVEEIPEDEPIEVETEDAEAVVDQTTDSATAEVAANLNEGDLIDDVLQSDVQPNDLLQSKAIYKFCFFGRKGIRNS